MGWLWNKGLDHCSKYRSSTGRATSFPGCRNPFKPFLFYAEAKNEPVLFCQISSRNVKGHRVSQMLCDRAGCSSCAVFLHPPSPPPSYSRGRDILHMAGHQGSKDSMPVSVSQDKTMTTSLRECWGEREGQELQGCGSVVFPSEMLLIPRAAPSRFPLSA